MDSRWQPNLDHPACDVPVSGEARGLFAAGWYAADTECRIVNLTDQSQQIVAPETWRSLRELGASIPAQLAF